MTLHRRLFALFLAVAVIGGAFAAAGPLNARTENVRYAAIVVDAASGEVLFARRADSPRYPASITKVMTLYLAFDALQSGKISKNDVITVSPRAASQPPSKLGLAAGQTITVDDAMKSLAVRSANDMAVALAEHIGGSEARFAALMTLKAEELGMTQTRYVNANGLPDSRQLTSARDLAILSRAVLRDFPQYYSYFGIRHWNYGGRDYSNTNGLLHSGQGYDGIKTGYTNASGYNLAASAVQDGKRLITIVLGGRSTATRNTHVDELMKTGFEVERLRSGGSEIQVAQNFFEARGYGLSTQPVSTPVAYASVETPAAVGVGDRTEALNAAPPAALRPVQAERAQAGSWSVQVGAFKDAKVARDWLGEVTRRFRSHFRNVDTRVMEAGEWYRSRYIGLTREAAEAACAALAERRVTCQVVRPG